MAEQHAPSKQARQESVYSDDTLTQKHRVAFADWFGRMWQAFRIARGDPGHPPFRSSQGDPPVNLPDVADDFNLNDLQLSDDPDVPGAVSRGDLNLNDLLLGGDSDVPQSVSPDRFSLNDLQLCNDPDVPDLDLVGDDDGKEWSGM
jgi:hypothetical protein